MVIRRIGVGSAAKVGGALYGLLGLIVGVIFACFSLIGAGIASTSDIEPGAAGLFGALFGVGAIIFFPVLYAVMGFVMGALTAALYNLIAGVTGGLTLEVDTSTPSTPI